MKKLIFALLTLSTISYAKFEVLAEVLYYRPSTCGFDLAVRDPRDLAELDSLQLLPEGEGVGTCPDFDWGFRVGLGYCDPCRCLEGRINYAFLHSHDKVHTQAPEDGGLWIQMGDPKFTSRALIDGGKATLRTTIEWQSAELSLGWWWYGCRRLELKPTVGIHWVDLRMRVEADYQGAVHLLVEPRVIASQGHEVKRKQEAWGVGPRFSVDWQWPLACGFGVGGQVGVAALAGQTSYHLRQHDVQSAEGSPFDVHLDHSPRPRCHLFPEFDAGVGINYLHHFCCALSFMAEFGYEWRSYVKMINRLPCDTFSLDGLYLRLCLHL